MLLPTFPCVQQDYGGVEQSIRTVLSQRGLQQPANFVTKVVQMYDTMCVRFGLMLVGPTGGGKTTCCGTLQGALTHLRKEMNHPNDQFQVGGIGFLVVVGAACAGHYSGIAALLAKRGKLVLQRQAMQEITTRRRSICAVALFTCGMLCRTMAAAGDPHVQAQPQVHQDG
jgi:hypothetical protein